MGKKGRSQKKTSKNPKRRPDENINPEDMDDEIDAFHKQRDVIPLDINGDVHDSDDENEYPVFDMEEDNDGENDVDDDGDDDDDDDGEHDTGMAAKIKKQQKFLWEKFGRVEDEMHDGEYDDEDKEGKKAVWGGKKQLYHGDNRDFELQSCGDDSPAEEEEEVKRMLKERAESLDPVDFGLSDSSDSEDESDKELTLEEKSAKGENTRKSSTDKEAVDGMDTAYEEVKKDLNSLSKEDQMDVVYSLAPELVGLLSELKEAVEQLEEKVNPLLNKIKEQDIKFEGGLRYLEIKQLLLVSYCQAITFYLLLKSDGQPVRDHPVIARLVEIKDLLDKMKELDGNLPAELDDVLKKDHTTEKVAKPAKRNALLASDPVSEHSLKSSDVPDDREQASRVGTNRLEKEDPRDHENQSVKRKRQNDQVGVHSMEMLKVRAVLEEKLKQKGVFSSITSKPNKGNKRGKLVNGQLETYDDFDDDTMDVDKGALGFSNGHGSSFRSSKLSQLVTAQANKSKAVSGDDDLPKRDDIGERRRKHELRVLAGAGVKSEDDGIDEHVTLRSDEDDEDDMDDEDDTGGESEDEFYKQVKQQRVAKLAAKAEIYTRTAAAPSLPEETIDGKRQITYQMEKNRGLTRPRKKQLKNPRKKYRTKHEKAVVRRKGQVRDIRKPSGPYGGETTGINPGISRSTRFKS